jgi:Fe-S cluster assembly ATP-binding protein
MPLLEVKNLHVGVEDEDIKILNGVDLTLDTGDLHAIMGPNGSGKSTLAAVLAGREEYEVLDGEILFDGEDLLELEPEERAEEGIFLAFQYPVAVPGATVAKSLRHAINSRQQAGDTEEKGISIPAFRRLLTEKMDMLDVDHKFAGRYLNEGFSGGEKKRAEILQMATLEPKIAIMDETDSGLDIDALRVVAEGANRLRDTLDMGLLVITHYQRILNYVEPDYVHIMLDGHIVESGGPELAVKLEERGYDWLREKYDILEEA